MEKLNVGRVIFEVGMRMNLFGLICLLCCGDACNVNKDKMV